MIKIMEQEINYDKCYLRMLETDDVIDAYVSWLNDPFIYKYLEIRHVLPIKKSDVIDFVKNTYKIKRPHWGIFYEGSHIGNISCSWYDLKCKRIDISFLIGERRFLGRGICTHAVYSVLDYLFNEQNFKSVQGGAHSGNIASIKVFEKLNFNVKSSRKNTTVIENEYQNSLKYEITKKKFNVLDYNHVKFKVFPLKWKFFDE